MVEAPTRNEQETTRSEAPRAAASIAAGTVLLVFGVGIGIRHWMIAGLTWGSTLGTIALVAGVGGVIWGVSRLGRARPGIGKAMLRLPVVVAVAVVVWTFSPALLATLLPHVPAGALTPADLGLEAEAVTYTNADGVLLAGWYIPADGPPVVVRHGAGSDASTVLGQAAALVESGFTVLVTDARGHGRSAGRAMDFGWFGDLDIAAAIDFLSTRHEVGSTGVAVVGVSMGGEEAVGAAAADDRIVAVVAEGATARTADDKVWLEDAFGFRGTIQVWLERAQYGLADLLTPASAPIALRKAVADAAPAPVLLIVAGERGDEARAAEHIRAGSPESVSIWEVPGSEHAAGFETAPDEWATRVAGFLRSAFDAASI